MYAYLVTPHFEGHKSKTNGALKYCYDISQSEIILKRHTPSNPYLDYFRLLEYPNILCQRGFNNSELFKYLWCWHVGGVGGRIVMGHPVHFHSVHVYRYCKILGLNLELTAKNCIYDLHIHLVLNKRLFTTSWEIP